MRVRGVLLQNHGWESANRNLGTSLVATPLKNSLPLSHQSLTLYKSSKETEPHKTLPSGDRLLTYKSRACNHSSCEFGHNIHPRQCLEVSIPTATFPLVLTLALLLPWAFERWQCPPVAGHSSLSFSLFWPARSLCSHFWPWQEASLATLFYRHSHSYLENDLKDTLVHLAKQQEWLLH